MKIETKLLGSIALSALLIVGFTGCGDETTETTNTTVGLTSAQVSSVIEADRIPFGDGEFSPYERVAVFPTVKDGNGDLDHNATYAKVAELATTLATYVARTDEPTDAPASFKGTNWILAGVETAAVASDDNISKNILGIPTKLPINPNFATSATNTKKVKVIEVCNSGYASQALGVKNVGDLVAGDGLGAKVANGSYHATALPCEITIYNDDKGIYVDMLNPETIFTLFFTEVFTSAEMENVFFKEAMLSLPSQVKGEIYAMIYKAFDDNSETYTKTDYKMGPLYSTMTSVLATTDTANGGKEPYRHYKYTAADSATEFTATDAKNIAAQIMEVMTIDGAANVGAQETALFSALPSQLADTPVNPKWRSGRHEPLKVPGGTYIVEACSPTYAKEATATGEYHTAALPCEIAVKVNPDDNNSIDISILNPEFMFGALFADAMAEMDATEIAGFNTIIDNINGDLLKIVDYAMENNITAVDGSTDVKITPIVY